MAEKDKTQTSQASQSLEEYLENGDPEALIELLNGNPEMKKRFEALWEERNPIIKNLENRLGSGFRTFIGALGISEGIKQQRYADRELAKLKRPEKLGGFRPTPGLQRALTEVNRLYSSPERSGILEPMMQSMREAYGTGLSVARDVSGGQSGSYGAQAQALYNQRLKEAQKIPYALSELQGRYGQERAALLSNVSRENMAKYNYDLHRSSLEQDLYTSEAQRLGELGSQGRLNKMMGVEYFGENITPIIARRLANRSGTGVNLPASNIPKGNKFLRKYMRNTPAGFYGNGYSPTIIPNQSVGSNLGAPLNITTPQSPFLGVPEFDNHMYDVNSSLWNRFNSPNRSVGTTMIPRSYNSAPGIPQLNIRY